MDGELNNLIKVWILAITCLIYCYCIASRFPRGIARLISLLPVFYLFIILPLNLSTVHFSGVTSFFLVWLASFKLLLFAFDQGPLFQLNNKLLHFILVASLPIKIKPDPPVIKSPQDLNNTNPSEQINTQESLPKSPVLLVIKFVLFSALLKVYDYRENLHPYVVLAVYCCHLYLELEIVLAMCATPARVFGFELESQFNEPYLATSLQDFWGRRWNLMVTSILRPTVYNPTQNVFIRIMEQRWAQLLGVIATFVVSGIMHEVIYYYLARVPPTWEVTWFFILQGICVAIEVFLKKKLRNRFRLHRAVAGPLVLAFVAGTGVWLFFAQIFRNKLEEKVLTEVFFLVDFIKIK